MEWGTFFRGDFFLESPLTQDTNADLANKVSSQISFLTKKNWFFKRTYKVKCSKSVSKTAFLKGNKLYFK